jgi:mannosyltransferase OCH1-like enzyme
MIPLILHQTWKTESLTEPLQSFFDSWTLHNPEFERRFYNDRDCREFIRTAFPPYLDVYDGLPFSIQRADLFRYLVIYRFGGLYADIDMECLRPIKSFLCGDGAIFSIEAQISRSRQRELGYRHPYQIANCIFAASPGDPFLLKLVETVASQAQARPAQSLTDVEDTTGPHLLTRLFYQQRRPDARVLEQIYWQPPRLFPDCFPLNRNMFARHWFLGSWKDVVSKSLRRRWIDRDIPPNPFPSQRYHRFDGK